MATFSEDKPSTNIFSERFLNGTPKLQIDLHRINRLASLGLPRRVPCNAVSVEDEPGRKNDSPCATKTSSDSSEARKRKADRDGRDLERKTEARINFDVISAKAQNRKAIDSAKEILSIRDKDKENINPGGEYYKGREVRKQVVSERSTEKKRVLQVSNKLQNSLSSFGSRKVGSLLVKPPSKVRIRKDPDCFNGSVLTTSRDEEPVNYQQQIDNDMLTPVDSKRNLQPLQFVDASRHVEAEGEREGTCDEILKETGSKPPISVVNCWEVRHDREGEGKWYGSSKEVGSNPSFSVSKYLEVLQTNRENQGNWYETSKEVESKLPISVASRLEALQNDRERDGKWCETSKEVISKPPISVANYLEVQESSMSSVTVESEQNGSVLKSIKQLSSSMNGLTIVDTSFHDLQTSTVEEKDGPKTESNKDPHLSFGTELKHSTPNCQVVTSDPYRSSVPIIASTTCSITIRTSSAPLATSYTDENVQPSSSRNLQPLAKFSPNVADKQSQRKYEHQSSNNVIKREESKSPMKIALAENGARKPREEIPGSDIGASKVEKKVSNHGDPIIPPKRHIENENMVVVNGKKYQKLKRIGRGGSSEVFKVLDREHNTYALKRIKLKGRDYGTARGFYEEIELLTRLQGKKYIIRLIDHEVTDKTLFSGNEAESSTIKHDVNIYMVLEFGEVDLATMLQEKLKERIDGNNDVDETWLRFYWKQILEAVNTVHEARIMHGDLKPANFMLVKGVLKLIDFGIAKSIQSDTTNIERESQVGTLNYMSPEAFLMKELDENGNVIKCGRSSDIWALGCILYQMVYGKTPFAHITSLHAKIQEVANPRHKINYLPLSNPHLLDIMKKCLTYNRDERSRIPQLLSHPFLQPVHVSNVGAKIEEEILRQIRVEEGQGRDVAALVKVLERVKMLSL